MTINIQLPGQWAPDINRPDMANLPDPAMDRPRPDTAGKRPPGMTLPARIQDLQELPVLLPLPILPRPRSDFPNIMNADPNIADLLKQLRDDTTTLVREEISLAKTEMSEKAAELGKKGVMVSAGALLGYAALMPLLLAFGYLLRDLFVSWDMSTGTATFLGLLIVALITGAIAAGIVMSALAKKTSLKPEKTIHSLQQDKNLIQEKLP